MLRITASRALCHGRPCKTPDMLVLLPQRRLLSSRVGKSRKISSTSTAKKAAIMSNPSVVNTTTTSTSKRSLLPLHLVLNPTTKSALPWIGNISYMALASGFLMTDMLELRVMLVGGYAGLVAFHTLHERPLRIPLRWSALFVAVNAAAACYLLADRYATLNDAADEELYQEHFERYLTRGQFKHLIQTGRRQRVEANTRLTSENVPCDCMYFLLKGQAQVFHGEKDTTTNDNIATIEQGGFVNDVAFQRTLNQHQVVGAYGTVVTTEDSEVLVWDISALKQHMASQPDMERSMNYCMSDHLVKSLLRQRHARHTTRNPLSLE